MTTGIDLIGSCKIENIDITVNALSAVISCPNRINPARVALIMMFGVTHKEKIDNVPQMNLLFLRNYLNIKWNFK